MPTKFGQLVIGPAGSGKSTFCTLTQAFCETIGRTVHIVNLDPAAPTENLTYSPSINIRDLICLEDVMEKMNYGPNGGLVYCMEYFLENISWFLDQIADFQEDYLLFDCPGQIELYTHVPIMKTLCEELQRCGYSICGVFILDSLFVADIPKFFSGMLSALAAMIQLELPHINVLSKCDLRTPEELEQFEKYSTPDICLLTQELNQQVRSKYHALSEAIGTLLEEFSLVSFLPLNPNDESIENILGFVDHAIQYGEENDVIVRDDNDEEYDMTQYSGGNSIMGDTTQYYGGNNIRCEEDPEMAVMD